MNRRYFALVGLCVGLGLATSAVAASAAPAAATAPGIPGDIKNQDRIDAARAKSIRSFIDTQLARIASGSLAEQQDARDLLVRECDTAATPAFIESFVDALVAALPKAMESSDHHARLNVAIVVGRVAERTKSLRLKPAALSLLADKDDGVVIWGARMVRVLV